MRRRVSAAQGFTLLEMLVVIAVMGILLSIGFSSVRTPSARLLANDYRAMVQQARFEAIKRNVPVKVVWNSQQATFTTWANKPENNTVNCSTTDATELTVKQVSEYRNAQVSNVTGAAIGIVWLPSGLPRSCSNTANVTGAATFSGGGSSRTVQISSSGRISIQ